MVLTELLDVLDKDIKIYLIDPLSNEIKNGSASSMYSSEYKNHDVLEATPHYESMIIEIDY